MKRSTTLVSSIFSLCLIALFAVTSHASDRRERPDEGDLPGTYYANYPVLFGESGDVLKVEKFLTLTSTEEPHLLLYDHCWRLTEGQWNHERGALVVKSSSRKAVEFNIVEASEAPADGSTGFFEGRMVSGDRLDITYNGLGRAIVFRMDARRTDVPVDEFSCPLE